MFQNRIIQGDALSILPALDENSVDVVFADPPYNLQLQHELWRPNMTLVDAVNDAWDQFDGFDAYDHFTRVWLTGVRHVMKDTATIWISGTYHNIFRVGTILQDLGFWLLNTVTWFKPNAMPNFRGTRFKNDVEFVIWAKYSEQSAYTFNHHAMKQFNDFFPGKQLGCVWTIPVCGGTERLRNTDGQKLHSTQKPEELLQRILIASSQPGDVVLDPFMGTGTTAAVAKRLRRRWIGIERDETYVTAARQRIAAVDPLPAAHPLLKTASREKPRRVPFLTLLERGYLHPGQRLRLGRTGQRTAVILEDGRIQSGDVTGSIHRVGAHLKNAPSCNGWMHWYYRDEDTGELMMLDTLREKVRQTLRGE
ncbi:MAG: site-specific DNA-methyltransferase [Anaerolineae bacterium]|nr:site-specific DNA-methyltransferase [Anaerolineae bacterium]